MPDDDHDLLIEVGTDVKWIRAKLGDLCGRADVTELRVDGLALWRAEMIGLEIPERMKDHDDRITAGANRDWMTRGVVALLVLILGLVGAGRWMDLFW